MAINRVANMMRPSPPQRPPRRQPQMTVAIPQTTPRRRNQRRRSNSNNSPSVVRPMGNSVTPGAAIRVVDTEYLAATTGTIERYTFNPAPDALARLQQFAKMYHRFKINRIVVHYEPGVGTATTGNVAFGICIGPAIATIDKSDEIMKLCPSSYVPAWKASSISVGRDIDIGRYMICGGNGDTSIACTLYVLATAKDLGIIRVSYDVAFSYPVNF